MSRACIVLFVLLATSCQTTVSHPEEPTGEEALRFLTHRGFSERYACRLLKLNRSTYQYVPRPDHNQHLREELRRFVER